MNDISNPIILFAFDDKEVRAVSLDGTPYLVGKDVAERLGYADPTTAMKSHCRGVQKLHPIPDAKGRTQKARILSEPDVLRLIMGSTLPAAQRFERWVFEEVLPSIRKTGHYSAVDPMKALNDPAMMRGFLLSYSEKVITLQGVVAVLAPKADGFDRIATSEGSICITDAAKTLQVLPGELFRLLRSDRWIYKRAGASADIGYQDRINAGLLEHKIITVTRPDGSEKVVTQVRVTPNGLVKGDALGAVG